MSIIKFFRLINFQYLFFLIRILKFEFKFLYFFLQLNFRVQIFILILYLIYFLIIRFNSSNLSFNPFASRIKLKIFQEIHDFFYSLL